MVPGDVIFEWVNGSKFLVRPGETGLTGNTYCGLQEFPDMGYLLHVLRKDDLFIDVGANVGSYTVLASAAIGARAIAFEPVPQTYKRLMGNIELNHLETRVEGRLLGIGNSAGHIEFTSRLDTVNHALADGEKCDNTTSVEVSTLDILLKDESPAMIKIDVEGYETPVLEGANETLKKKSLHSVIMELNGCGARYNYSESSILKRMSEYGFKTYSYDPITRTLINLHGKNTLSGNTIFIRDEETIVAGRLKCTT